jgi:hypothetical protein
MSTKKVNGGTRTLTGVLSDPSDLMQRLRARTQAIVQDTSRRIAARALARAPVRTGALRSGIVEQSVSGPPDEIRRVVGVIGEAGKYARFVLSSKIGTRKQATDARYFLTTELGNPVRESRQPMAQAIVAAGIQEVENG